MHSMLNERLKGASMTKKELAEKTGYGRTSIWKWSTDKGIRAMSIGTAEIVARAIGCKPKDLFED